MLILLMKDILSDFLNIFFCKNLLTITKNDVTLHFDDKSKEFSGYI